MKNKYLGIIFIFLHFFLFHGAIILFFSSNNITTLIHLLINFAVIYIFNIVYGDCPISIIENYHLDGKTFMQFFSGKTDILQNLRIFMACICAKIIFILRTRYFNGDKSI